MQPTQILKGKVTLLRKKFIEGDFDGKILATKLHIARHTVWRYQKEFERIRATYPDKLTDYSFYMPTKYAEHRLTPLYLQFQSLIPQLFKDSKSDDPEIKSLWKKYKTICPDGYQYATFKLNFKKWKAQNVVTKAKEKLISHISDKDLQTLNKWRHSKIHRTWQIAVVLKGILAGATINEMKYKTEATRESIYRWINTYNSKGLDGFERKPQTTNIKIVARMKERKENVIKLIHETPKLYGINRTSWTILALTQVYNRIHNCNLHYMQLSYCLKQLGYKRKQSRDMLTTQDPKFREKINKIQKILQKLRPSEKFFSIDEYGPVGVRLKGGSKLMHESEKADVIPQKQKSKGVVICTAALELSTNQITYFYSKKKNTFETIKLIDVLREKYKDQERLYLCWDAAPWHKSKILYTYLEDINNEDYRKINHTPEVKLAPLPTCTQFLNVIESVFAGLAKAVIHNSDYQSTDECKEAINLHFEARNQHYLQNPKHAGNKIWGKELVVPKFSETQQCKSITALQSRVTRPLPKKLNIGS